MQWRGGTSPSLARLVCLPITGLCTYNAINGCGPGCKVAADCDDKNPCTFEVCNAFNGTCIYQNLPNCNPTPKCTANADCNDNNVCTSDICNPSNSTCLNAPIAGCNRNQQCMVEADCDDKNKCTVDVCNTFNSTCVHVTLAGCTPQGPQLSMARRTDTCSKRTPEILEDVLSGHQEAVDRCRKARRLAKCAPPPNSSQLRLTGPGYQVALCPLVAAAVASVDNAA